MTNVELADSLDAAIELAIVPSFSNIGPLLRRRLFGWAAAPVSSMVGRTVVITGPTSGIGHAAATALGDAGARLVLVGRDAQKLDSVRAGLAPLAGPDPHASVVADMSSLASVRAAAAEIARLAPRIDVLIDNAGAMYARRAESVDGIEATLATLVCGPFVLITALLPNLRAAQGRVISVTSGGMYAQPVRLDDLQWQGRAYNGTRAYAQAKRIQVALIREWARRYAAAGVSFNAMHPGWVATRGLAESLPGFARIMRPLLRSPEDGADTIVWLATAAELPTPGGKLYLDRRPRPFDRAPQTRLTADDRAELWDEISEISGARPG